MKPFCEFGFFGICYFVSGRVYLGLIVGLFLWGCGGGATMLSFDMVLDIVLDTV